LAVRYKHIGLNSCVSTSLYITTSRSLLNYHEIELPEANLDAHWVYIHKQHFWQLRFNANW
jgi:hypothetical protein